MVQVCKDTIPIAIQYYVTIIMGHSIPNQQKKSGPLLIFVKIGTTMDPFKKLSHTKIWLISLGLPLSYDHSKFLLKILFCLHIFNKMAITLLVIDIETSGLEF